MVRQIKSRPRPLSITFAFVDNVEDDPLPEEIEEEEAEDEDSVAEVSPSSHAGPISPSMIGEGYHIRDSQISGVLWQLAKVFKDNDMDTKAAFEAFDLDGDGKVSTEEFVRACPSVMTHSIAQSFTFDSI